MYMCEICLGARWYEFHCHFCTQKWKQVKCQAIGGQFFHEKFDLNFSDNFFSAVLWENVNNQVAMVGNISIWLPLSKNNALVEQFVVNIMKII